MTINATYLIRIFKVSCACQKGSFNTQELLLAAHILVAYAPMAPLARDLPASALASDKDIGPEVFPRSMTKSYITARTSNNFYINLTWIWGSQG